MKTEIQERWTMAFIASWLLSVLTSGVRTAQQYPIGATASLFLGASIALVIISFVYYQAIIKRGTWLLLIISIYAPIGIIFSLMESPTGIGILSTIAYIFYGVQSWKLYKYNLKQSLLNKKPENIRES